MIQHQVLDRYYSRDKLHEFLKKKFGDRINFQIQKAGECITFKAPEQLTAVSLQNRSSVHADIFRRN